MKKFLIAFAVAAIAVTGAFAQDDSLNTAVGAVGAVGQVAADNGVSGTLQGTWYDSKYDCLWVLTVNSTASGLAELRDANGGLIYKFTRNNVQNFKLGASDDGLTVSFDCAEKNRQYKFTKPLSVDKDLKLHVYNTYYKETHDATITYKDGSATKN